MCGTFYLWVRCLKYDGSWWIGVPAGLMYTYMVANWGGFIFVQQPTQSSHPHMIGSVSSTGIASDRLALPQVINMIAFHAAALVLVGRHSSKLHRVRSTQPLGPCPCRHPGDRSPVRCANCCAS